MNLLQVRSTVRGVGRRNVDRLKRWSSMVTPYQPMQGGRQRLDAEYAKGDWDYLRNVNELPRFSVVIGYCNHFNLRGKLLEVGCGEGLLQERLCPEQYSRFVGLDISAEAIQRAALKSNEKIAFVQGDAATHHFTEHFDAIIFNECLEYFDDPLSLVKRYEQFLERDGIFIVSMFAGLNTTRTRGIWKQLESLYHPETSSAVTTRPGYQWVIKVFRPVRGNV